MVTTYFHPLNYTRSVVDGFYLVESGHDQYYVCAYKDRHKGKKEIIDSLNLLPSFRGIKSGDFDFHHVIEEQHLADITFSDQLFFSYGEMPTVMVHKGEHKRYNAILHTQETRHLYLRDKEEYIKQMPGNMRKQAAMALLHGADRIKGIREMSARIGIMKEIYKNVYTGNRVLKTIAGNILDKYQQQL